MEGPLPITDTTILPSSFPPSLPLLEVVAVPTTGMASNMWPPPMIGNITAQVPLTYSATKSPVDEGNAINNSTQPQHPTTPTVPQGILVVYHSHSSKCIVVVIAPV